jgi:threonine dehydrogenase-like Zn-dependent dehydrogenase
VRAALTTAPNTMELGDVPEPPEPGAGELLVHPDAVGLCGSDYHFFDGTLSEAAGGGRFPRILGHEVGAVIEAVGPGCREELQPGRRIAMHPLIACGHCYPCRIGRTNRCANFTLIGIHADGGLQERLVLPQAQAFAIDTDHAGLAALVEPVSIAVRAVVRARVADGERVVVLGAGPIGQSVALAALDRGAQVLVVDPLDARLETARALGAHGLQWTTADEVLAFVADWTDGDGPPVVVDATGAAEAIQTGVEMVALTGRVAVVGMSGAQLGLRIGTFAEKELDLLGVACCGNDEFIAAVDLVERHGDALQQLISHEFPLERAPAAIAFAIDNPATVMKVMVRN